MSGDLGQYAQQRRADIAARLARYQRNQRLLRRAGHVLGGAAAFSAGFGLPALLGWWTS